MGHTGRRPAKNSNLHRKQANYYERASGRRTAQEPPIADTFGARGASHETTNLGPDKTAWLGTVAVGSTPVMELAAGPDRTATPDPVDRAMALLREVYSAPTLGQKKNPREDNAAADAELDRTLAIVDEHLLAGITAELGEPDGEGAFRANVRARLAAIKDSGEPHTDEELVTLAHLTAQKEELDEAFGDVLPVDAAVQNITGSQFPPDIADLLREDDRHIEQDVRTPSPDPLPYSLPGAEPPLPGEIAEQALRHIEERQGEQ